MSDSHCHDAHDHAESLATLSPRTILFAIVLNTVFVVAQVYYGFVAHSLSLLADAGHNFGDILGLVLAGIAIFVAAARPNKTYTYGLKSATILAALANALLLLLTVIELVHASVSRLLTPAAAGPDTFIVMVVALVAVGVNGATAWILHRGPQKDLNIRGMYLHMLSDAAVSVGVVVGALIMKFTHAPWLDPVISLLIAVAILWAAWQLLHRTMRLALQGIPDSVSMAEVETSLKSLPGVVSVHDLHVWALGTSANALSAHLTIPAGHPGDAFFVLAQEKLEKLGIEHTTLQVETEPHPHCGCGTH